MQRRGNLGPFRKFDEIRVQAQEAFMPRMLTLFDKIGSSAVAGFFVFYYFAGRLSVAFCHRATEYVYTNTAPDFLGEIYKQIHSIRLVARQDKI